MDLGLLLDIDGTLVDSNDAHARAWVEALAEAGVTVAFERVRPMIGMGGDKILPRVAGLSADDPRAERISARRRAIFKERHFPTVRAFPGVRDLLLRAREEGWRLTAATSASEEEVQPLLERAGVADLVPRRTSSDDADRSKPDPDIVRAALAESGTAPERSLMLGDTPYDVEAAARSGVRTLALRCGGWDGESLSKALAVYDDPADLLARFDGSPLRVRRRMD
jgi:HAD superfamily hydrolase (TIGR01509 family)